MNRDKLEALRALAADPRTPENEARNAALTYVRGGGQVTASTPSSGPSVEELHRQIGELEAERDRWKARADLAEGDVLGAAARVRERREGPRPKAARAHDAGFYNWNGAPDPFQDLIDFMNGKRRSPP